MITNEIEQIAKKHFQVETMAARKQDSLDFYDVSIVSIKAAFEEAYNLGLNASKKVTVPVN